MKTKAKRWLAAVLAIALFVSSTVVGFAYVLSSPSQVPFLASVCTRVDGAYLYEIDMAAYFEEHPTADDAKQKILEAYNAYLAALDDPSKSILVKTSLRSGSPSGEAFAVFICNTSDLRLSVTSPYFRIDGDFHQLTVGAFSSSVSGASGNQIRWTASYGYLFFGKNPVYPPSTPDSNKVFVVGNVVNFRLNLTNLESPSMHTLTINYLYAADNPAADPAVRSLAAGTEYSIPSPEVAGYTPDKPLVSGIMPDDDLTIDVYYGRGFWPLTVRYQYADGTQALDDVVYQYPAGFNYQIPTPELAGYKPDKEEIAGEMPAEAVEAVVTYTANPYTLTVAYRFTDGSLAAESHQEQLTVGTRYYVTSPQLEGYRPNQTAVSGVMPASDVTHTVTYRETSGGGGGDDPFGGTEVPPYAGKDPFVIPGLPSYTYDPFIIPGLPPYGYDPFVMPDKFR